MDQIMSVRHKHIQQLKVLEELVLNNIHPIDYELHGFNNLSQVILYFSVEQISLCYLKRHYYYNSNSLM